jgi:prepilin-type N-terminal cleavage/methylation domain-containing protein
MNRQLRGIRRIGRQAGFSLIELVLVLTIIGAATIITISAFNTTDDSQQVQEEVNNVNALSGAIRHMFNTQGDYNGLTNTVLLRSVAFPEQMRVPSSTTLIKHSWLNDGIDVAAINELGTADDSFTITLKAVPDTACASIASTTFRHFIRLTVGSTDITNVPSATTACTGSPDMVFVAR